MNIYTCIYSPDSHVLNNSCVSTHIMQILFNSIFISQILIQLLNWILVQTQRERERGKKIPRDLWLWKFIYLLHSFENHLHPIWALLQLLMHSSHIYLYIYLHNLPIKMPMRSSYLKLIFNVPLGFFSRRNLLSNIGQTGSRQAAKHSHSRCHFTSFFFSRSPSPTRSHFHAGSVNSLDIPATAYKMCSNEFFRVLFHVLLWFFCFSFFFGFCLLALVTFIVFSKSMKHKRRLAFPHLFDLFVCWIQYDFCASVFATCWCCRFVGHAAADCLLQLQCRGANGAITRQKLCFARNGWMGERLNALAVP